MESTFLIEGKANERTISKGTVFFMARPYENDSIYSRTMMITAAHVLEGIKSDTAVLHLRKKSGNTFFKTLYRIKIREKGKPLWAKHPVYDIAVMDVALPNDVYVFWLPTKILATETFLKNNLELLPGQEALCLGYPKGISGNNLGFPILRTAKIASYPIFPIHDNPMVLLDGQIFDGNSGGPVFMNPTIAPRIGSNNFVLGLKAVIGLISVQYFADKEQKERLVIAGFIPSPLILETIEFLPKPKNFEYDTKK